MKTDARTAARGALIAAMYVILTWMLQPLSFGAVQLRLSEALCMLPVLLPESIAGVTVGCLLSNILLGGVWYDALFGTLATLIAALLVRRLKNRRHIAALMPGIVNAVIVGPVVYFAYAQGTGAAVLLTACGGILAGELVVCFVAGLPLLRLADRIIK